MSKNPYTMILHDKQHWKDLAKKHNHKSLAKLIKALLKRFEQDPTILNPTSQVIPPPVISEEEVIRRVMKKLQIVVDTSIATNISRLAVPSQEDLEAKSIFGDEEE